MEKLTTDSFHLTPDALGHVYLYRSSPKFSEAWSSLLGTCRTKYPPLASLRNTLRCLSNDLVHYPGKGRTFDRSTFLVSRTPIDQSALSRVLSAWESRALGVTEPYVSDLVDELEVVKQWTADLLDLKQDKIAIPLDIPRWFWSVAHWNIARILASKPLDTDHGPLPLRIDSEGNLWTWSQVLESEKGKGAAVHRIEPRIITVAATQSLAVKIDCTLVRLVQSWPQAKGKKRVVVDIGSDYPILNAQISHVKKEEGGFHARWADQTLEVLKGAELLQLPDLEAPPTFTGPLRCGFRRPPKSCAFGRGVGPHFREYAAHHAFKELSSLVFPVEMKPSQNLETRNSQKHKRVETRFSSFRSGSPVLRIVLIYASSKTRQRYIDGILSALGWDVSEHEAAALDKFGRDLKNAGDSDVVKFSNLEFHFFAPERAEHFLVNSCDEIELAAWIESWTDKMASSDATIGFLVETCHEGIRSKSDQEKVDPKHLIRRKCARIGIATQFLDRDSKPKSQGTRENFTDHPAKNAILDLFRSCGFFLHKFPATKVPEHTWFIGAYCVKAQNNHSKSSRKRSTRGTHFVSLVAIKTGTTQALSYLPGEGWLSLGKATTRYLSSSKPMPLEEVANYVEGALSRFSLIFSDLRKVVIFDANGCRSIMPFLRDTGNNELPGWLLQSTDAVVRCRSMQSEIPRTVGKGSWTEGHNPAGHSNIRNQVFVDSDVRCSMVVSGSSTMSNARYARHSTRFLADRRDQRKDWHSLSGTELLILHAKSLNLLGLHAQLSMLCRLAPHWDGVLRWPIPLHLARAIVRDRPEARLEEWLEFPPDGEFND